MSQAWYQKYRPTNFEEIIGQDNAVQYLKNIIDKDKASSGYDAINHAYLFTGSRGVGKTTLARLFARGLGTQSTDIIELDTASNRGIDEVKELREATLSRPIESKYKVFILDEVHMITTQGANALLKTLEEPTPWTIFILCTTDPDKLIATIVSRCQVITLDSPQVNTITQFLSRINREEKLGLDTEVLTNIAESSHESYRDAAGELERLSPLLTGSNANEKSHIYNLNYDALALRIIECLLSRDLSAALNVIADLDQEHGANIYHKIYNHILTMYRVLLLSRVGNNSKLIHLSPANQKIAESIMQNSKDKIRSDILYVLLDSEKTWNYNSINNREKLELVLLNIYEKNNL